MYTLSVYQSCARSIVDRCAYPYRLKKLCAIQFDGFCFHLKSFSRFVNCQQGAVVGDMRNDFYFLFPGRFGVFSQKLCRRNRQPGNRRGNTRKCSGAYQREQSRSLCGAQTLDRKRQSCKKPAPLLPIPKAQLILANGSKARFHMRMLRRLKQEGRGVGLSSARAKVCRTNINQRSITTKYSEKREGRFYPRARRTTLSMWKVWGKRSTMWTSST